MQAYQERVVVEKKELDEKIVKLEAFIAAGEIFKTLEEEDQWLLKYQAEDMAIYSRTLGKRIARF